MSSGFTKDIQYYKFCMYGFLKNLRFFEPFLILFLLEKEISFFQIGTLYAVREILINILEIPSGVFADVLGRKRSLMTSFLFYIISFVIFFYSQEFYFMLVAIIFYAIGDAFRTGTHKAMIFEYLRLNSWEDQRANYYGNTRSWSQIGSAISSLAAAAIVFYSGNYSSIFLYSILPYLADFLLIASYPNALNGETSKLMNTNLKQEFLKIIRDFVFAFKHIKVLKAISNLSVHSGFHRAIKDYLQPVIQTFALSIPVLFYLSDKQKTAVLIGVLYFIVYLLTAVASRKAGAFKDKTKSNAHALNITMYVGFSMAFISGLLFHYTFYMISIVLYLIIFLVENLRNPIGIEHVSNLFNDKVLATALSTNSQAKSLLAALMAPVLGFFADQYGIGISLMLLALILMLLSPLYFIQKKNS